MDGVLIDSQPMHYAIEKKILSSLGHPVDDAFLKEYTGWGETAFWTEMKKYFHLKETPNELKMMKRHDYTELLSENVKPNPKLAGFLSGLKEKGIQIAVASSSNRDWVRITLEGLGIQHMFDAIVCGSDVERGKPFPDVFLEAAKRLGVNPSECIVLEDSPAGIQAANRAGIFSVVILHNTNNGLDFSEAKASITSIEEVIKYV